MTLKEGQRVKLAADTRLTDSVEMSGLVAGFLSLAAGTEGTVERVVEHHHESDDVREYERLKSLLDAFGREMPTESRKQLEEKVGSLEPQWIAFQKQGPRVTVRVRFDNGFILDEAHEDVFTSA
ncbi:MULTISPECIES: hypothetical protein [unclassified Streptomyces]|uniref:hypothetical protein n=1 Tax=unclassified Streptomyces TaxID=2593676 RepID=UPI001BE7B49F|nr:MULTISPECIES: hypothetical protein [unclassified Streptomyces]MBT2408604.1 hypothetical protein [Streptomyces sp. ISL-21]MBT2458168.1 hypothetical protein [Streptomyces sp. ISL-86]MBT2608712.1 hypothetical protein [Streptomyces sp. ISL-87]